MVNYDRIELEPKQNAFFDEGTTLRDEPPTPGSFEGVLNVDYAKRVAQYESDLMNGYKTRWGSVPRDKPSHTVALPGNTATVVYDAALDRRLLAIYVKHGWEGIRAVQTALDRAAKLPHYKDLHPWPVVKSFYRYTHNRLLALIRSALINIERRAADDMVLQLSLTAGKVNEAWVDLDIKVSTIGAQGKQDLVVSDAPSPSLDSPVYIARPSFYRLGNTILSGKLYDAVLKVAQGREEEASLKVEHARVEEYVESFSLEMGHSMPSDVEEDLAKTEQWIKDRALGIELLYGEIYHLCPLAVLVIPLLSLPFSQLDMEQTLGEVMVHFRGEAERLGKGLSTKASWLEAAIASPQPGKVMEQLYSADLSVEETAVKLAIDNAPSKPAYLSLLSEATLYGLVNTERIKKDSLEWVVLSHYICHLKVELAAEQQKEKQVEDWFALLTKGAALLSLALWFLPAGRVAKGVSIALGISLLIYQSYSVIHHLSVLDLELSKKMAELDREDADAVTYITELAMMRSEYVEELNKTLIREVLLIVAAKAWPDFAQLVHLRGYYQDLETLVGE